LYIFSLRSKTDLDIVVLSAVGFDKEQNRILGGKGYGSEYPRTAK
jgi:5-formyltetrahydrofolate cyclo-ligase